MIEERLRVDELIFLEKRSNDNKPIDLKQAE